MAQEYSERKLIPPAKITIPFHIFYEGFEDTLKGAQLGSGTDWIVRRNPAYKTAGDYGLELQTKETTPAANNFVRTTLYSPIAAANIYKVAIAVLVPETYNDFYFDLTFANPYTSISSFWGPALRIKFDTGVIQVWTSAGAYETIATLGDLGYGQWVYVEMILDFKNKKYKSVKIGNYAIDASAYSMEETVLLLLMSYTMIRALNASENRAHIFVDDLTIAAIS